MSLLREITAFLYIRTYGKRGCRGEGWSVEGEKKNAFRYKYQAAFCGVFGLEIGIHIIQKGKLVSIDV